MINDNIEKNSSDSKNEYQQDERHAEEGNNCSEEKREEPSNTSNSDEDPYDAMITFLTGRSKSERSPKERAIIFPVKVSYIYVISIKCSIVLGTSRVLFIRRGMFLTFNLLSFPFLI